MKTHSVELVWEKDCPNVESARSVLRDALGRAGLPMAWSELEIGASDLPQHARGFGSPTILVDGAEVTGLQAGGSDDCCRVYFTKEGMAGVPSVEHVIGRLGPASEQADGGRGRG